MDIDVNKKIKGVRVHSNAGYGLLAMTIADTLRVPAYIIPLDKEKSAYDASKEKIIKSLSDGGLCKRLVSNISFGDMPEGVIDPVEIIDIISPEFWQKVRDFCFKKSFHFAKTRDTVLVVPRDYDVKNLSGTSLKKQNFSSPSSFFNFLRIFSVPYVYMGHFDKNSRSEVDEVFRFAVTHNMEIPGEKTQSELFGVRGVPLADFNQFYENARMLVNVANTTAWHGLLYYPSLPQVIYFPEESKESWCEIAKIWGDHILALSMKPTMDSDGLKYLQDKTIAHMKKYLL